ncbi:16S rRNA (cytidine1402-2'-O)-methyltransferase [Spiroplasma corruscae]|uniref:16S rRNA (Cytidine1402-2'-O)-methyltransferase n=1 Tax=Spiroplasma corruscae TaxID=216934 RepID=A0A222EQT0_9MOLU|nr:16S rRNA (cytidine(1402)-2'-O)-methyltransferase [Spiroplasma corruscae]ASP28603.1 16S rRNA (cytidine1402-2'-O)-methyltransferase [Spiroplasma corruscae]
MLRVQNTFKNNLKTVYLIGTPIGNLKDISFRAIEILKKSDVIFCEDKRVSVNLLNHYNITTNLRSLHKYNELEVYNKFEEDIQLYKTISIISDAGVPCISDPGKYLINKIVENNLNINITAVNAGPAYIHSLIVSGFLANDNIFLGFLKNKNNNEEIINVVNTFDGVICFYESVHRIVDRINSLSLFLSSDTNIVIGREITKINEQFIYGNLEEVKDYVNSENFIKKGEFCILINVNKDNLLFEINMENIEKEICVLTNKNITNKEIIKIISKKYKINKNKVSSLVYKK